MASRMAAAIPARARCWPRSLASLRGAARSRPLAALQNGPELLMRFLQLGCGIGARQRRRQGRTDDVAEFGDRDDDGKTELADPGGIDRRLQPFLRQLDALAGLGIIK